MTMPTGKDKEYRLDASELEQIGRIVGPEIREKIRDGVREDLDRQTKDFRSIINTHETHVTKLFTSHETRDDEQFDEVKKGLKTGDSRMGKVERKLAWATGVIGAIAFLTPMIIELVKWKMK